MKTFSLILGMLLLLLGGLFSTGRGADDLARGMNFILFGSGLMIYNAILKASQSISRAISRNLNGLQITSTQANIND